MSGTEALAGPDFGQFLDSYKSCGAFCRKQLRDTCASVVRNNAQNAPVRAQGRDSMHRIAAITTSVRQTWTSRPTFWNI